MKQHDINVMTVFSAAILRDMNKKHSSRHEGDSTVDLTLFLSTFGWWVNETGSDTAQTLLLRRWSIPVVASSANRLWTKNKDQIGGHLGHTGVSPRHNVMDEVKKHGVRHKDGNQEGNFLSRRHRKNEDGSIHHRGQGHGKDEIGYVEKTASLQGQ